MQPKEHQLSFISNGHDLTDPTYTLDCLILYTSHQQDIDKAKIKHENQYNNNQGKYNSQKPNQNVHWKHNKKNKYWKDKHNNNPYHKTHQQQYGNTQVPNVPNYYDCPYHEKHHK